MVQLPKLTNLALSCNALGPQGAAALASLLQKLVGVERLILSMNEFRCQGVTHLAPVLGRLQALTHIWLDYNSIGLEGAKALLPELLKLPNLVHLHYDGNGDAAAAMVMYPLYVCNSRLGRGPLGTWSLEVRRCFYVWFVGGEHGANLKKPQNPLVSLVKQDGDVAIRRRVFAWLID